MQRVPGRPGLRPFAIGGFGGIIAEFTWGGDEVFRHVDLNSHHDVLKLANGNYLYLAWEPVPQELRGKVRGGIKDTEFKVMLKVAGESRVMFNDVLVEIDPQQQPVWVWRANEYLDPDVDILAQVQPRQEWSHVNAIQEMADGNILITARTLDSMMIIDKRTKKIIFRWGNMTRLDKKTGELVLNQGTDTLSGPHDAREIPPGFPGAGHLTCYDNGFLERSSLRASRAVEIDRATRQLVWQSTRFKDGVSQDFGRKHYSPLVGSAEKLPNGNMMMCEGINGRLFQVTENLEEVWEYLNPFSSDELFRGAVFKAQCYAPDYCPQFKDLPPAAGPSLARAEGAVASAANPADGAVESHGESGSPWTVVAALAACAALLAFVAGWTLGRRIGLKPGAAIRGTAKTAPPTSQRTRQRKR